MKHLRKTLELGFSATIISTLLLTACGGGGGTAGTNMTITPTLGQFAAGTTVNIRNNDGSLLATATVNASGVATVTIPSAGALSPLLIEVGQNGDQYFDEKRGQMVTISGVTGAAIRALVPDYTTTSQVAVTTLTEIAVGSLTNASNVLPAGITAASAAAANTNVATSFNIRNLLTILPRLIRSMADLAGLGNTAEDDYAAKLAGLANMANANEDALAVAHRLRHDMNGTIPASSIAAVIAALNSAISNMPSAPAAIRTSAQIQPASGTPPISGVPATCSFTFTNLGTITSGIGSLTPVGPGVGPASGIGFPFTPSSAVGSNHACMDTYAWVDTNNASAVRQINLSMPQSGVAASSVGQTTLSIMIGNTMLATTSASSVAALGITRNGKNYTFTGTRVPRFPTPSSAVLALNPASAVLILNGTLTTP